jgi:hypothetical protein
MAHFWDRILRWSAGEPATLEGCAADDPLEVSRHHGDDLESEPIALLREEIHAVGCAILRAGKP